MVRTLIRNTADGRPIEVIDGAVCLDGHVEARELVALIEHPNRQAILRVLPNATHMAGRLALTMEEANQVQDLLDAIRRELDLSPAALHRRMQDVMLHRAKMEGVE
jgi:hypothetical protein